MPKKAKYLIQLQKTNGGSPSVVFEITEKKFESIIQLLQPEIKKKMDKTKDLSPISVLDFF